MLNFFDWIVDVFGILFGLITQILETITSLISFLAYVIVVPLDIVGSVPYILSLSMAVILMISTVKFILGR